MISPERLGLGPRRLIVLMSAATVSKGTPIPGTVILGKASSLAGQHPYVIYNALRNSTRYSRAELLTNLGRLMDVDAAMKSTGQSPRLLLERLLIDLCVREGVASKG